MILTALDLVLIVSNFLIVGKTMAVYMGNLLHNVSPPDKIVLVLTMNLALPDYYGSRIPIFDQSK